MTTNVLTLVPDNAGTKFMATGASLGFSERETQHLATKRPLTTSELMRLRSALETGFYELWHAEPRGNA